MAAGPRAFAGELTERAVDDSEGGSFGGGSHGKAGPEKRTGSPRSGDKIFSRDVADALQPGLHYFSSTQSLDTESTEIQSEITGMKVIRSVISILSVSS
jgi:hypothetical protein